MQDKNFGAGMKMLSTIGLIFGITVGSLTTFGAINLRSIYIAERQLSFAKACTNPNLQIEYLSFAAQIGNKKAIQIEYAIGQNLMLEALNETDKEVKAHKFEEVLKIFDRSAVHSQ
ncbi:MAG: hypothetical protein H0T62_03535 [Parachlamydiaceae bacterium]|nr:hypothetical protein [Parachlamydiaceae bacterium]